MRLIEKKKASGRNKQETKRIKAKTVEKDTMTKKKREGKDKKRKTEHETERERIYEVFACIVFDK